MPANDDDDLDDIHAARAIDLDTTVVRGGREMNHTAALSPPIWQTSTFRAFSPEEFDDNAKAVAPAEFYTRYGNPVHKQVEALVAKLEGAERALLTSSGMAAIHCAILAHVGAGDHIVAQSTHYAGTHALLTETLPRFGVTCTLVDQTRPEAFEAALRKTTKLVYLETPSNPLLRITDLRRVARASRAVGATTVVDNTFATPINQRPLALGIDAVVHSATKGLAGHHDVSAGVIAGPADFVERCWRFSLVTGPVLGPFDAWLLLRGLRTLPLRVRRQNESALAIAQQLVRSPLVSAVFYPGLPSHPQHALARAQMNGFGSVLSFTLASGDERALPRFIRALSQIPYAPSLGGVETMIVAPGAMWSGAIGSERHPSSGGADALLRLTVGLESPDDLIVELEAALRAAT